MDLNDWILALHLLAAFALVGAEVIFAAVIVSLWGTDSTVRVATLRPVTRAASGMVIAGAVGTIVFGVWLALSVDAYALWDGWVIAAIVLWAIAVETGRRAGASYGAASIEAGRLVAAGSETSPQVAATFGASPAFWVHVANNVVIVGILVVMIWKPGA